MFICSLLRLQQQNFAWFKRVLDSVHDELPKWNAALFSAQRTIASTEEGFLDDGYQIKVHCYVRFVHIPPPDPHFKLPFPNHAQLGQFREVKGTVVRMTQTRLLEVKREFVCSKCKTDLIIEAVYGLMFQFEVPKNCTKPDCKGTVHQKHVRPPPQHCVQYQELKIQVEHFTGIQKEI